ncbi:MAG: ABC transporter substrate-binding protein [Desulfosporosinus sp.]|nr:ABC transporter substrate-binding protein [Desulfosporosinus sp.]
MIKNTILCKLVVGLLLMSLLLAGCSTENSSTQAEAKPEGNSNGTVSVYTSVPQDLIDQFKSEFEKKYPNLKINVYQGVTNDILAKLKAEKEAGATGADVVWVADTASAEVLKSQKYLAKYTSPEGQSIPDSMKDNDGYYYGSRVINMVLAYNTANTTPPTSWNDLLNPKYKGRIGLPSVTSGTSYSFVGDLASNSDFGWNFFEKLKTNGGVQVKANNDAVQKLASGEFTLTVVLDYMIKAMKDKGSPVDYVIPKEGAVMVVSPIALIEGAKNAAGGKKFIDYVLSKEGQEMMSKQNVVSVRSDITPPNGVPSIKDIKPFPSNDVYLNNERQEINDKFNSIFGK